MNLFPVLDGDRLQLHYASSCSCVFRHAVLSIKLATLDQSEARISWAGRDYITTLRSGIVLWSLLATCCLELLISSRLCLSVFQLTFLQHGYEDEAVWTVKAERPSARCFPGCMVLSDARGC